MSRAHLAATKESVDYVAPAPLSQGPVKTVLGLVKEAYRRCMYVHVKTPQEIAEYCKFREQELRQKTRIAA